MNSYSLYQTYLQNQLTRYDIEHGEPYKARGWNSAKERSQVGERKTRQAVHDEEQQNVSVKGENNMRLLITKRSISLFFSNLF